MCHGNAWETLLQSIGNVGRVWVPMICLLLAHFLPSENYIIVHIRTNTLP